MRKSLYAPGALFVGLFLACSPTRTTPSGLLAEVDVASTLPPALAVREAELESHTATRSICSFGDHEGALLELRWKTLRHGADAYITRYAVELVKSADHLAVSVEKSAEQHSSLNVDGPFKGVVTVRVRCRRQLLRLDQDDAAFIQLWADGSVTPK